MTQYIEVKLIALPSIKKDPFPRTLIEKKTDVAGIRCAGKFGSVLVKQCVAEGVKP